MNAKKFLIIGIVSGVVFFLLGWLLYGKLLADFFQSPPMDSIVMWALAVGNLLLGFLLSFILLKTNSGSLGSGLGVGLVVGLLFSSGINLIMYGVQGGMETFKHIAGDVGVTTVMWAVAGAIGGAINGSGSKASV